MSPDDEDDLFVELEQALLHDDGRAAQEHLRAGRPIFYGEDAYPEVIREWPDGRRELVGIRDGQIFVERPLGEK